MDQRIAVVPRRIPLVFVVPLLVALTIIGAAATPVAAKDAGGDVTVVNPIYAEAQEDAYVAGGPFTATGAAVGDGLLCAAGTLGELYSHGITIPDDDFRVLVLKELTCADRPGALTLALWVDRIDGVGNEFEWRVLWGTEGFEGICGGGEGTGMWAGEPAVIDSYGGELHTGERCKN